MANVDSIVLMHRNVNTHPDEQVQELAQLFREFGFLVPVVLGPGNVLAAGEGRYLAAKLLGLAAIPAINAGHLSEEQVRKFALADNKISKKSVVDLDALATELNEMLHMDYDLSNTGYSDAEISTLLQGVDDFLAHNTAKEVAVKAHTRVITTPDAGAVDPGIPPKDKLLFRVFEPGQVWKLGDTMVHVGGEQIRAVEEMVVAWEKSTKWSAITNDGYTRKDLSDGQE